jgi:hypothetical protein
MNADLPLSPLRCERMKVPVTRRVKPMSENSEPTQIDAVRTISPVVNIEIASVNVTSSDTESIKSGPIPPMSDIQKAYNRVGVKPIRTANPQVHRNHFKTYLEQNPLIKLDNST